MAEYTLPDLPYDYGALDPHISGKIMELHHDKHHQAYVTGANTALEQLAEARETGNLANVNKLEKDLAFNLGGHINHSVFWQNMSPNGGGEPEGALAEARASAARWQAGQALGPLDGIPVSIKDLLPVAGWPNKPPYRHTGWRQPDSFGAGPARRYKPD